MSKLEIKMDDYFHLPVIGDWDEIRDTRGVLFKSPKFDEISRVAAHAINTHDANVARIAELEQENNDLRNALELVNLT